MGSVWGQTYPFCPGRLVYVSAGFACCKRSHHIWDNPKGTAHHGPPAYATKQRTVCHYHMGGHQWNRCQKCTGAGASSHVESCSVCKQRICHYLLTFYITLEACPHLSGLLFLMCFKFFWGPKLLTTVALVFCWTGFDACLGIVSGISYVHLVAIIDIYFLINKRIDYILCI